MMDSCFIYKLPKEEVFYGAAGRCVPGLKEGFVISPFASYSPSSSFDSSISSPLPGLSTITREREINVDSFDETLEECLKNLQSGDDPTPIGILHSFPQESLSQIEHAEAVRTIVSRLNRNEKTVLARLICGKGGIDIQQSLLSLAGAFPNAFVFAFHSPLSGTWLGASPETLLIRHGASMKTMALAGTRKTGTSLPWDIKNIEEQEIVTRYIAEILNREGFLFSCSSEPFTMQAGPIEHLCSEFDIPLSSDPSSDKIEHLLHTLSPTPALCGYPKEKALEMITEVEKHPRGFYGGFAGPMGSNGDFSLFVILRSIRLERDKWCMPVGGGITPLSDPYAEWMETQNKASAILDKIKWHHFHHHSPDITL